VGHLGRDDLQAGGLEARIDLADDVLGNGIGLDDREGSFTVMFFSPEIKVLAKLCILSLDPVARA
jgi:hypothetical protein